MSLFDIGFAFAQSAVAATVEIRSNVSPEVVVPLYQNGDDTKDREPGAFDWALRLLKPSDSRPLERRRLPVRTLGRT
jgi:hypothetical protein